jgi:hypothetical protein
MKKVILTTLLGATSSLMAMGAEHAYLYKDPRIMGMGGANIAVGAYSTSIFSNPAGLSNISKDDGFVVEILNFGLSSSEKTQDFVNDLDGAEDDIDEISKVIDKYSGDVFSIGANNYSSVSKNSDFLTWSVGILASSDVSAVVHGNGSTNGAPVEVAGRAYGGLILGGAKTFKVPTGTIDIGVGMKYIIQKSYEGPLYISDIQDDDSLEKLQEKYEKDSSGFGVDLGVLYKPFSDNYWHPAFGLSILNIGNMGMDDNYGQQPLSVNIGASVTPEVDYLDKLVIAIDYIDIFNQNEMRIYTFNETSDSASYEDYKDIDFMKRLRLGIGAKLINSSYFSTQLNAGIYQSAYTLGLDMEIAIVKLNIATYQEQIGTADVDIPDRRYMAQIGIGW